MIYTAARNRTVIHYTHTSYFQGERNLYYIPIYREREVPAATVVILDGSFFFSFSPYINSRIRFFIRDTEHVYTCIQSVQTIGNVFFTFFFSPSRGLGEKRRS